MYINWKQKLYSLDASTIIHIWDNYPKMNSLFSALWDWIAKEIQIENLLEIQEEKYGDGVDENDILIIATAKVNKTILITEEARQPKSSSSSSEKYNYRIPAVCNLKEMSVTNIHFTELLNKDIGDN